MKNGLWAEEVDEPTAQRVADIVGTSSAAGRALRQLAERRLAGEDVVLLKSGRMFFVAPRTQVSNHAYPVNAHTRKNLLDVEVMYETRLG